jgi:iron complex outermembrane recepter protein
MLKLRKVWLYAICLLLPLWLPAQERQCSIVLRGEIADEDGHLIEGAELFLSPGNYRVLSDRFGGFVIKALCAGRYTVHISHHAEEHLHTYVEIWQDTAIRFILPHEEESLSPVLIHTLKQPGSLGKEDLNNASHVPGAAALAEIPGIRLLQTGITVSKPIVQGMWGMRVPIFTNGARLEGQNWGMEHAPELEVQAYNQITLVQGSEILKYGHDALGGLLHLTQNWNLHRGERNWLFNSAAYSNGRGMAQFVEYNGRPESDDKYSWRFQGGWRRAGNQHTPDYYLQNSGIASWNVDLALYKKTTKRGALQQHTFQANALSLRNGIFSGSHVGNLSDLQAAMQRSKPITADSFSYAIDKPWQQNEHAGLLYRKQRFTEQGTGTLLASLQYDRRREFDFNRRSNDPRPQLDLQLWSAQLNYHANMRLAGHWFEWGFYSQLQYQIYRRIFLVPGYTGAHSGLWLARRFTLRNWNMNASLRVDGKYLETAYTRNNNTITDNPAFLNASAAVTAGKSLTNKLYLEQSLFRLWRNPWLNELYSDGVHRGTGAYELGNANLQTETSYKYEARLKYQGIRTQAQVGIYANRVFNFMNLEPSGNSILTVRGALPLFEYRQYNAVFSGINLNYRRNLGRHWQLMLQADAGMGSNTDSSTWIPLQVPPAGRLVLEKSMGKWNFYLSPAFTARMWMYESASDYLPPPEGYWLLDARVAYRTSIKGGHEIEVAAGGSNLLNTTYRNYLNRFRYYADEPGRNVFLRLRIGLHYHHHNHHENHSLIK